MSGAQTQPKSSPMGINSSSVQWVRSSDIQCARHLLPYLPMFSQEWLYLPRIP